MLERFLSVVRQQMLGLIALFVALGGTSYAVATGSIDSRELKNNTVRSKDIRNNGVTTQDLKNSSARGADVRDDSLTGADVLESSLGTVPTANTANSAATAGHASTASDAAALGGLGADAFLRSNLATVRNPVAVDDPVGGGTTRTPLITAGPVRLEGECSDDGGVRSGLLRIVTSTNGTQLSTIVHGANETVLGDSRELAAEDRSIMGQSSSTPAQRMGVFVFNHPASGSYRAGTMFISLNTDGDCAFGITAFG